MCDLIAVASETVSLSIPEMNVAAYIAGYLIMKARKRYSCENCFAKWISPTDTVLQTDVNYSFIREKKFSETAKLVIPSEMFVECVAEIEGLFLKVFESVMHSDSVRRKICRQIEQLDCVCSLSCQNPNCDKIVNYLINLYVTVRIAHVLRRQNRNLQQKGVRRNRKILKLQHV